VKNSPVRIVLLRKTSEKVRLVAPKPALIEISAIMLTSGVDAAVGSARIESASARPGVAASGALVGRGFPEKRVEKV